MVSCKDCVFWACEESSIGVCQNEKNDIDYTEENNRCSLGKTK